MTTKEATQISKLMSFLLRHKPEDAGLELDDAGWVLVDRLLTGMAEIGRKIDRAQLDFVVETNGKKRYEFSSDGSRIRASQGHSIKINLKYEPTNPPEELYHGTATRFLDSIETEGLNKMQRHHVHLSADAKVAIQVGGRHGKPVILTIRADDMHKDGHEFYLSTNNVWLTGHVPPKYITEL